MRRLIKLIIIFPIACSTMNKEFQDVKVDSINDFKITNEDSSYNAMEGLSDVKETVIVTSDVRILSDTQFKEMDEIKFTKAILKNNTLDILIFETNTIFDYKYRIKIVDNKFKINFWYQTTIDTAKRDIMTLKQMLVLNKSGYKKGQEIRGYTEYEGKCKEGCERADKQIVIKGNFKVTIE